jgi:hypothetical protein
MWKNKKKSLDAKQWITYQLDVLSAQIDDCLSWYVRARVIMMENDSSSTVYFHFFSEDKWFTIQEWQFYLTPMVELRHVQFFRKNRRPFPLKCFVRELLLLGTIQLGRPIRWTAVLFLDHMHRSMIRQLCRCYSQDLIVFLQHFIAPIDTSLFLHACQIVGDPTRTNFFNDQMIMQYLIDWCHTNVQGCQNLLICDMTILNYQFTYSINIL